MQSHNAPTMTDAAWEERVKTFWNHADEDDADTLWPSLEPLLAERPDGDAAATYERASLHDFLSDEHAAIPLYRRALATGLDAERHGCASIQLASSLRNVGQLEGAIDVLEPLREDVTFGLAARAFLALALHDLDRKSEALELVLTDHAASVPMYGRALGAYAKALTKK